MTLDTADKQHRSVPLSCSLLLSRISQPPSIDFTSLFMLAQAMDWLTSMAEIPE